MSILIKSMEMPKTCRDCPLERPYEGYNCAITGKSYNWALSDRPSDCPLVPVSEHGDLVDRNEMFVEFVIEGQKSTRYKVGEKWELNGEEIRRVIQRLPAVIPAEEGE